jgi:hypothetical protein
MHLIQTRVGLGTITLSAPGLSSLSYRWLRAMNWNLLCSCTLASFNTLGAMTSTRRIRSGSLPQAETSCDLHSSQLHFHYLCFFQVPANPLSVSGMPRQRGKSKRGSAWQPSGRVWLSDPLLHHLELVTFFTFLSIFSVAVWTKPSKPPVHLLPLRKPTGMVFHL